MSPSGSHFLKIKHTHTHTHTHTKQIILLLFCSYRHNETSRVFDIDLQIARNETDMFGSKFETKIAKLLVTQGLDGGRVDATSGSLFRQGDGIFGH